MVANPYIRILRIEEYFSTFKDLCNRFIKLYGGVSNQFLTGNCGFDAYLIYFEGGLNGVKMCNINPKVGGSIIWLKMGKK